MFNNREIRLFLLFSVLLSAAGGAGAFFFSTAAGLFILFTCAGLLLGFLWFTRWRYRELSSLSDKLRRAANAGEPLDLQDYREGELSVLCADLQKTASSLSYQAQTLQRDKEALCRALSDTSHQLKTPLCSMLLMNDLMAEDGLPKSQRDAFLLRQRMQIERLQWLVESLLKLSKIDAQAVPFEMAETKLSALLQKAAAPLSVMLDVRGISLKIEGDAGVTLACEPAWTAEALLNLLKNAAEHTTDGGVIEVRCSQNPLYTEIVVKDFGEGISPADLPHIFERFYRGENAREDSVGIGLALSKAIAERQRGTLSAQSGPGRGAAFTLRLYRGVV